MKAIDINKHLLALADWVNPETTCDKIIIGNPEKEISRALVTWISSYDAIRHAAQNGYDIVITHEPTFWESPDDLSEMMDKDAGIAKKKYIEDHDLVVLRCHDVWDIIPEIGVNWAWPRFLGFVETPVAISENKCQHRYDVQPMRFSELVEKITKKTAELGEPNLQIIGDKNAIVSKIGIGIGCATDPRITRDMGCDVSLVCDDGTTYWKHLQWAVDDNHPIIRVSHGTSEVPGMVTLAEYINKNLSDVSATHLPYVVPYRLSGRG